MTRERVLVAMSGGVDSSVAAALLLEAGHEVVGVTLRLWGGETDSGCCSVADVEDARRVAAQLGIAHYVFNLADDFDREVVGPYVEAYAAGRTPNPCVACNRTMKLGRLLERAVALGFDAVATGHHARVEHDADGRPWLVRGADHAKDQSYVLAMTPGAVLERLRLPIGALAKTDVRAVAARLGLRTAAKPESMDVCFVARGDRAAFVERRAGRRAGLLVDPSGRRVGAHEGIARFTIGQRRGLGVAAGDRRYVVDIDAVTATVTIGEHDALLRDRCPLDEVVYPHGAGAGERDVLVQTRAHGTPVPGVLGPSEVRFLTPHPRVAPGQVIACYEPDAPARVVAGAIAA